MAPPWTFIVAATHTSDGLSTSSATTLAAMGNSIPPMLRMAMVLGPRLVVKRGESR